MPELLKRLTPVARRPRGCDCCGGMAIAAGERYERSTYFSREPVYNRSTQFNGKHVYDVVSCMPCKALAPLVWHWSDIAPDALIWDDYRGWATEMTNDVVHGEAARAWLFRAAHTLTPINNNTKPAALAESIEENKR